MTDVADDDALKEFAFEQPHGLEPSSPEPRAPGQLELEQPAHDRQHELDQFRELEHPSESEHPNELFLADGFSAERLEVFAPDLYDSMSRDAHASVAPLVPPYETNGRVQVAAAVATVGLLAVMYVALVQQRSAVSVAFPPAPTQQQPATDADHTTPAISPAVDDDPLAQLPVDDLPPLTRNSYRPPPFEDVFGLTRGLAPSIRPDDVAPPPVAAAEAPSRAASPAVTAPQPAAEPAPVAAPAPPPASVAVAAPPSSPTPAPSPPTAVPEPPRTAAIPQPSAAPQRSAAPPLAATPSAAATQPAAPAAAPPAAASAIVSQPTSGIQNTLTRYRQAFSTLDAGAARKVWPTVDERTLSRAFEQLERQEVSFEGCLIDVNNDRAEARCNGTARYVPRIGSRTQRVAQREWRFSLVKVRDEWLIGAVEAR